MKDTPSKNLNVSSKIVRRARMRLNETERRVLYFFLSHLLAGDEYHAYSRDKILQSFTKKSQRQLCRALLSLSRRGLLACTPDHSVSGCPRLYHLIWYKLNEVRELLRADGYMAGLIGVAYGRLKPGSVTTPELAHVLNISKRSAQRIAKANVNGGIWRRRKNGRKRRYVETRGQLPLEHFTKERSN